MPRLAVGDVLVADACEVHRLFLGIAELEGVEQGFHLLLHVLELLDGGIVHVEQLSAFRYDSVEVFLCELQRTVHEVAIDGHELVVVAVLEVLPCEVVVLRLRRIGGKNVAQHVLLAGEIDEVFVEPHCPVARCGNLVVLKIEELVGGNVVGKDVAAVRLEHGGEHDAVEHDVVLADEVYEA